MLIEHPEKLVRGRYNLIYVKENIGAILEKDGEYYEVSRVSPFSPRLLTPEMVVVTIVRGSFQPAPEPILLEGVREWPQWGSEVAEYWRKQSVAIEKAKRSVRWQPRIPRRKAG